VVYSFGKMGTVSMVSLNRYHTMKAYNIRTLKKEEANRNITMEINTREIGQMI